MTAANYPSGKYYTAKAPCLQCNQRIRRQGYPSTVKGKRYCTPKCRDAHRSQGHTRLCRRCQLRKPKSRFGLYNKVCNGCYEAARKTRLEASKHGVAWQSYTTRAKYHKPHPIPFALEREEFDAILNHACHYCGTMQAPRGLDRIDTDDNVGYTLTNVVPACFVCNRMRLHLPYDAYLAHMRQIVSRHPGTPAVYTHPKGLHPWVKASSNRRPGKQPRAEVIAPPPPTR